MNGYTKLFNSIITSTIWQEGDKTRIVWITLLALSDFQGNVEGSIPGLANLARISTEDCEKSLNKLKQPDPYSRSKEKEGRRIEDVEGGWHIINYVLYNGISSAKFHQTYEWREKAKEIYKRDKYACQECHKTSVELSLINSKINCHHIIPICNGGELFDNENLITLCDICHSKKHPNVSLFKKKRTCNASVTDCNDAITKFDRFWELYPRKVGKGNARKSFERISPDDKLLGLILAAVGRQKNTSQWQKEGGQFIPHPATWLNQERWSDETDIKSTSAKPKCWCGADGTITVGNEPFCSSEHRKEKLGW